MLAISLLTVHLFNLAGYSLLFEYLVVQSDKRIVQQLDARQYRDDELIEVKVHLPLPYAATWNDYERVDGEMELNGTYYSYVKRKMCGDTLYLLCLPNTNKTQFYTARNEYAKQVNGIPSGDNNDRSLIKKVNIINEYQQPVTGYRFIVPAPPATHPTGCIVASLINSFIADNYKPPRV